MAAAPAAVDTAEAEHPSPRPRPLDALLSIPRGVAQVDFQPGSPTGLIFIIALFAGGWQFGVFGLLGTIVATVTAYLLGVRPGRVSTGLEGFCGTLIGVALVLYLGTSWTTAALVAGSAVAGSVLASAMRTVLTPYDLPALTAPFCVVVSVMVIGAPSFERVWAGHPANAPPSATDPGTAMTWTAFWHGLFNGIGQVFFQDTWYVGLIFLVGLAVASRRVAAAAGLASLIGLLVAWSFGAQTADIGAGLYGYNAVLTGIALTGTFVALSAAGVVYAVIGAATAAALTAGITTVFDVVGGHTLTWPFVLVTWVFLAAVPTLSRLRRAG
ncbi:urea transporter [Actinomadura darangshiensis]|uniref:Urea transporter n=1 Tax=Actinomadura darangshiensis TaxID=705336 RepID=A0A4R5BZZ6_9ACTN|nr:urea transporter [Actinomadura darangshiensis]TDD91060.1 urea transporter [Actinomadura darangshiensis]